MPVKLTVTVGDSTYLGLRRLSEDEDTTMAEEIRRSLGLLKFVLDELRDPNLSLALCDSRTGRVTATVQMPNE
ncbi:MAG: hypothetical protein ABI397_00125 [Candidatus Saccharimonas sp.]